MRHVVTLLTASLAAAAAPAFAASPTPTLKTGDYPGLRTLVVVGDPSAYGGDGVAVNIHPTTVRYDAATQSYVLHDYEGDAGYRFSSNEILSGQSSAAYTVYRDTATGSTLKLLNQSATNPVIALTYVTYGKWNVPQSAPIRFADNYMIFGQTTPAANMPRTGSASYRAILDGTYQNRNGTYRISGNASYTANFGNSTMSVLATPVATHLSNGSRLSFGNLSGSGYINSSASSFNAVTPYIGTTRYSSRGSFYGPQANEIGGAFTLKSSVGGVPGEGGGAFVGKRN